jgi:signal transduction histidine kinase
MGTRTLEARLTVRLVALAGAVLVAVGAAAVVVTDRVLDASDTRATQGQAAAARDAVARELGEGDVPADAVAEVVAAAQAQGVRLAVRRAAGPRVADADADVPLPRLAAGECATIVDREKRTWRACADGDAAGTVVAAVPIGAHRTAVVTLARGMASVVALALVALWLAVRRALRAPVAELTSLVRWTEQVVDAGQAVDPPPASTHEIAQLESAFASLVRRLLEGLARERASSAHIAHELRTPMTAIRADFERVRPADDASREAIARVRGDVERLADVIDAILLLSRGPGAVARTQAIVNVADLARGLAPTGALVEAPDEALIEGDEQLVSLAVRNLVDNARKYGDGARLLRVSCVSSAVCLSVVDAGPGIAAPARARMFDRYWRGTADAEGRGLGLALVRAVAERHGGAAHATAGPGGRGLEVAITLGRAVAWSE